MPIIKLFIVILAMSQLGACAVMSKKECFSADWQRVGYSVGADGDRAASDAFLKRAQVCAKHGAEADRQLFMTGHEIGIEQFCDPYNAVEVGIKGRYSVIQNQVCPESDYPGFDEGFRAGYRLYELNQDVYRANSFVADLDSRRSDYYRRIRKLKQKAQDKDTSDSERRSINQQCDSLEYQIRELSYAISSHENVLYDLQHKARRYQDYLDEEYLDPIFEPASGVPSNSN